MSAFFLELRNLQGKHKIFYSDKPKDLQRNTESMSLALGSLAHTLVCPLLKVFEQQNIRILVPIALAAFMPNFSQFL